MPITIDPPACGRRAIGEANALGLIRKTRAAVGLAVLACAIAFQLAAPEQRSQGLEGEAQPASDDVPPAPEGPFAENFTFSNPPVPAPSNAFHSLDGRPVSLADFRGKVVLVNFWATWCPPCKAEMPSMERLYAQIKNRGFELLAINAEVDGLEILPEFLQQHPHTFPIPVDTEGEVQTGYGVFRFPESFIIDRDGRIVEHIIGARDWVDRATIEHFMDLTKG
jgi:thiol-disulfide isomerase/thioredoxin